MKAIILAMCLSLLANTAFSQNSDEEKLSLTSLNDNHLPKNTDDIPFEALKTFVDVFNAIKENYAFPIDNNELMSDAITGMLTRLDPHSDFMNDQQYHKFLEITDGDYSGIGVALSASDGIFQIISVLDGSAAEKAGILSGDIITQINGQTLSNLDADEADELFENSAGDKVTLLIQRGKDTFPVSMIRQNMHLSNVDSRIIDEDIAYIKIAQFQDDTAKSVKDEVSKLQSTYELKGLIIDLRNNPGGVVESAISTADLFLGTGNIVSFKGNNADQLQDNYKANAAQIMKDTPIIVLINHETASAAEVLTAALKDNQRAIVIGSRSFGKGSVQTILPLFYGGAIKLTTALYYTPSNKSIQGKGIIPNIRLQGSVQQANAEKKELGDKESSTSNSNSNQIDDVLNQSINILRALILTGAQKINSTQTDSEKVQEDSDNSWQVAPNTKIQNDSGIPKTESDTIDKQARGVQ